MENRPVISRKGGILLGAAIFLSAATPATAIFCSYQNVEAGKVRLVSPTHSASFRANPPVLAPSSVTPLSPDESTVGSSKIAQGTPPHSKTAPAPGSAAPSVIPPPPIPTVIPTTVAEMESAAKRTAGQLGLPLP